MTSSTEDVVVSGRRTLRGSIIIRKSQLTPTAESYGRGMATSLLDHAAQHVPNVFDGRYFQMRQNPLYSSDSEQLDEDEDQDDQSLYHFAVTRQRILNDRPN